jgi:hypothetical protein
MFRRGSPANCKPGRSVGVGYDTAFRAPDSDASRVGGASRKFRVSIFGENGWQRFGYGLEGETPRKFLLRELQSHNGTTPATYHRRLAVVEPAPRGPAGKFIVRVYSARRANGGKVTLKLLTTRTALRGTYSDVDQVSLNQILRPSAQALANHWQARLIRPLPRN